MTIANVDGLGSVWTCPLCRGLFLETGRFTHRQSCVAFYSPPDDEVVGFITADNRTWTRDGAGLDSWSTADSPAAEGQPFSVVTSLGIMSAQFAP